MGEGAVEVKKQNTKKQKNGTAETEAILEVQPWGFIVSLDRALILYQIPSWGVKAGITRMGWQLAEQNQPDLEEPWKSILLHMVHMTKV